MPTESQILEALKAVIDPELRRDIVELEMVRSIDIKDAGVVDVTVSLTTPGCPIKNHFQTAVVEGGRGARRRDARQRRLRRPHRHREGRAAAQARPPGGLPEGALAAGHEHHLHRLRQGRRRQVVADRQPRAPRWRPRASASACSTPTSGATRSRACSASAPPAPAGQRRAQDPPARGPRPEGHVDRLLPQGGRGGRLARADAPQGAHAVPRGRRVGRARLPADRPAARHRRRLDDARPAAAAGQVRDRHDAAGRRRRRSRAARPRWPTRSSSRSRA